MKWALRLALISLACLSAAIGGLYMARVSVSNYIVSSALSDLGFAGSRIEITALTSENLTHAFLDLSPAWFSLICCNVYLGPENMGAGRSESN